MQGRCGSPSHESWNQSDGASPSGAPSVPTPVVPGSVTVSTMAMQLIEGALTGAGYVGSVCSVS